MSRAWHVACLGFSLAVSAPGVVWAQEPVRTYEQERLARVLARGGMVAEPAPEGRVIASITIVRHDVFVEDDPWPVWFNIFHWQTHRDVVERELLFSAGEPYREQVVQETMRNLRELGIFSLVSITAVKSEHPDQVGVLVYTRDLWTLRLEQYFQFTWPRFDLLGVQLTERNLFGRNKRATARFQLLPMTYSVGQVYTDHRVFGGELWLKESFDLIFNRDSGELEGTAGSLSLGRPFYDLTQVWSYGLSASYSDSVSRTVKGGEVATFDIPDTIQRERIPRVWDDRSVSVRATGYYRRGNAYKQTFFWGAGFRDRDVEPNAETGLEPGQQAAFATHVLPRVRREIFPLVGYELSLPRFAVFENLATFGQSENVRKGPSLLLGFELPLQAFGSSTDSWVVAGELGYIWAERNYLLELASSGSSRLEDGEVVDQVVTAEIRGATPPWLAGRLVCRGTWQARRADTSNTVVALGGDNGLRGYGSQALDVGDDLMRLNLEYRTLPLELLSVHLGGVLFYDVGSVYKRLSEVDWHHNIGIGLRFLVPQVNRYVYRIDLGAPLEKRTPAVQISIQSGQAVPLTSSEVASAW